MLPPRHEQILVIKQALAVRRLMFFLDLLDLLDIHRLIHQSCHLGNHRNLSDQLLPARLPVPLLLQREDRTRLLHLLRELFQRAQAPPNHRPAPSQVLSQQQCPPLQFLEAQVVVQVQLHLGENDVTQLARVLKRLVLELLVPALRRALDPGFDQRLLGVRQGELQFDSFLIENLRGRLAPCRKVVRNTLPIVEPVRLSRAVQHGTVPSSVQLGIRHRVEVFDDSLMFAHPGIIVRSETAMTAEIPLCPSFLKHLYHEDFSLLRCKHQRRHPPIVRAINMLHKDACEKLQRLGSSSIDGMMQDVFARLVPDKSDFIVSSLRVQVQHDGL
mmetsp:Transcript_24215/g.54449  ORF Transcript_24215/g.54449 Transcript_24215/m.54449 type:complete len:329 (-) Transcript_24215:108-1094(-)